MEEEHINKKLEIIKKSLAGYFNIRSSLITFSKLYYKAKGFCVEIEINLEISQNNLRTFRVITYMSSISEVSKEGFKYEKQYYTFEQMNPFLQKISHEIETME